MPDDGMGIGLFDEEDAERMLNEKLESHEWWIIVGAHPVIEEIEERFYMGDASDDFVLVLGPPLGEFKKVFTRGGILPMVYAHKRRMSAEQLAEIVDQPAAVLERRDILYPFDGAEDN